MKRIAFLLLFSALFILSAAAATALPDTLPDDDKNQHHHEDLTSNQLGTVHFPVSCSPSVQKPFERGVALLHSFWYEQAEATFQQIAKDDSRCAMAHWGVAMSLWHELWNHPDTATIKRGLSEAAIANSFHPKSDRERDYVAAISAFYSGSDNRKYESRAS